MKRICSRFTLMSLRYCTYCTNLNSAHILSLIWVICIFFPGAPMIPNALLKPKWTLVAVLRDNTIFLLFFQPLRLDIKRKLTARSDRVKSCDLHPTENWMLASLYNGNVHIWNIETQTLVKSFEVCDLPVRCARFVARKSWVVVGSDDMQVKLKEY